MNLKLNNQYIRRIGATALGLLLLSYIGYQVFRSNYKGLVTETAMYAEMPDSIQVSGWAVRDEANVVSNSGGVLNYRVSDGEKVAKGSVIADLYSTEDSAVAQTQLEQINGEISSLETLMRVGENYSSAVDKVGGQINIAMVNYLSSARKGEYRGISQNRDRLQYVLNQKKIITGEESADSYQSRLQELKDEQSRLQSLALGTTGDVQSPESGYFTSVADGYENAFDIENIADISPRDIEALQQKQVPSGAVGKIAKDFKWYVVAAIDEQQKIKLEGIENVKIQLPLVTTEKIPAQLIAVNQDEGSGSYAMVLECDYMSAEISALRNETMQIITHEYSGVLVNQKAIRFSNVTAKTDSENGETPEITENVKGVYVKRGGSIRFVQIFTDVSINGYAVCKLELNEEEQNLLVTSDTIQLYDEVITEGTDLYDGKLI